ncbi:hypothetical protein [Desulfamplus magnetovallimortis]|nr:hypothetical protein [Desulfamplus magnetovallimortis]
MSHHIRKNYRIEDVPPDRKTSLRYMPCISGGVKCYIGTTYNSTGNAF